MTKELVIKKLEKEALESAQVDTNALQVELTNLKTVLQEKMTLIEELRAQTGAGFCDDHESDDELTHGSCTRTKLKRRVFKKIEHLNEFIRSEVTPEIHERYATEISGLMSKHHQEQENLRKQHVTELRNIAQTYELKLKELEAERNSFAEMNINKERMIKEAKTRLRKKDEMIEDQARQIDGLRADLRGLQTRHDGHLHRVREKHREDIEQVKETKDAEFKDIKIKLHNAEKLIEEMRGTDWHLHDNRGEIETLRQEVIQLKNLLAKRLKVEKRFNDQILEKEQQIQDLLDYKKQWNSSKFSKLEDLVSALEKEKCTLKAKYKHKIVVKEESMRAMIGKELHSLRAELERKSESLEQREAELEILYQRLEELEMMQSSNTVEVKEV